MGRVPKVLEEGSDCGWGNLEPCSVSRGSVAAACRMGRGVVGSCSMYNGGVPEEVHEDVREVAARLRVLTVQGMIFNLPSFLARFPFGRLELLYVRCQDCFHYPEQHPALSQPCLPNLRHTVWLNVRLFFFKFSTLWPRSPVLLPQPWSRPLPCCLFQPPHFLYHVLHLLPEPPPLPWWCEISDPPETLLLKPYSFKPKRNVLLG